MHVSHSRFAVHESFGLERPLESGTLESTLESPRCAAPRMRANVAGMLALALAAAMQFLPVAAAGIPDTAAIVPGPQVLELELDPSRPTWNGNLRARLSVRRETRRFELRLVGPNPNRVEIVGPTGRVPLAFGWYGRDTLLVETVEPLAPGSVTFSVSFTGVFAISGPGLSRPDARHAVLERGAGRVVPLWPTGTPETPWRLQVHAPAMYDVIADLPRATRSLQRDWGTWEFASGTPVPADSLRVEVRPLVPHAAKKRGGATRRPRRR